MPASLPFRLARAVVFAAVCAVLGMGAHLAGGGTVALPGALAAFGVSLLAALPVTGRERSLGGILVLLTLLQALLHVMFSLAHEAAPVTAAVAVAHAHSGLVPGLGMLIMHGWAIGLTSVWLARGEAALWGLFRRVLVRLSLPPAVPVVTSPAPVRHAEPALVRSAVLEHSVSLRGPPLFLPV
ncbi:MFS transporter [Nonomuraea typhae]|uniref:MFS transporter n=1 Tax=Nonomuraea typhae TaxID=2603600 RepID=UPI0012FB6F11|nr:MFS transporter [Nonomuraea typhae]